MLARKPEDLSSIPGMQVKVEVENAVIRMNMNSCLDLKKKKKTNLDIELTAVVNPVLTAKSQLRLCFVCSRLFAPECFPHCLAFSGHVN